MRMYILASATLLALAANTTTGAGAFDHNQKFRHSRHLHAGGMRATVGREGGDTYDGSGYKDLGPLGFTFGCGRGNCQGFSVSAWSY